jgi:hypothetical protein
MINIDKLHETLNESIKYNENAKETKILGFGLRENIDPEEIDLFLENNKIRFKFLYDLADYICKYIKKVDDSTDIDNILIINYICIGLLNIREQIEVLIKDETKEMMEKAENDIPEGMLIGNFLRKLNK